MAAGLLRQTPWLAEKMLDGVRWRNTRVQIILASNCNCMQIWNGEKISLSGDEDWADKDNST